MPTKGDFIIDLLTTNRLSQSDRERILKLSAKEFDKNDQEYQRILSEIEGLKKIFQFEQAEMTSKIDGLLKKEEFAEHFNKLNHSIEDKYLVLNSDKRKNTVKNKKGDLLKIRIDHHDNTDIIDSENNFPILHNPLKTVEILKYFTENHRSLKYSTHSWEEGKFESYDTFMSKIKIEWDEIKEDLKKQSIRLHAKISNFLFNDSLGEKQENSVYYHSWGEKRLNFGWSSPSLKTHLGTAGNSPFSCPVPEKIKALDSKHKMIYFKDYTEVFKNEIEFREDTKNFKEVILDLWENTLSYDFDLHGIDQLDGFSFFTDVQYFKQVLKKIFEDWFKKRPQFKDILVEINSDFGDGRYHKIRICQIGSYISRSINDPKFINPTGDLADVIEKLKNLADYSLICKFAGDKEYRINYLTSHKSPFVEELKGNEEVLGFTHEFKFYIDEKCNIN